MRKKVGFIVQYYTFRNDMREFIEQMNKINDLTLFIEKKDFDKIPSTYKKVIINSRKKSFSNKIWNFLFLMFGNIPDSKKNYFDWRRRRIDAIPDRWTRVKEAALLNFQIYLPRLIDFDTYITRLQYQPMDLKSFDYFISFTDVTNPYLIAQVIKENKKLFTYVYSWDHCAKFNKLSKNKITYLTWNEGIKEDLIELHHITPGNIKIVGSTQFSLIHQYINKKKFTRPFPFRYIYFAASFGYSKIAAQEVLIIKHLYDTIQDIDPEIKLVLRPYPLLGEWDIYQPLRSLPNIIFQDYGQVKKVAQRPTDDKVETGKTFVFTDDDVFEKFDSIYHSMAIIHCGSTLGLEASYFDAPVIYLNYENFDTGISRLSRSHISRSNQQRHIQKYLLLKEYKNVITSPDSLKTILESIIKDPIPYLAYNRKLSSGTPSKSMSELVAVFMEKADENLVELSHYK